MRMKNFPGRKLKRLLTVKENLDNWMKHPKVVMRKKDKGKKRVLENLKKRKKKELEIVNERIRQLQI